MASRKASRGSKTSTTQRQQNLLRSIYRAGTRNMTNGQFRLGAQSLTEINMQTGRTRTGSYFIVREDLRRILRDYVTLNEPFISTYRHNEAGLSTFRVAVSADEVRIGCKTFKGKDAVALKQWALHN